MKETCLSVLCLCLTIYGFDDVGKGHLTRTHLKPMLNQSGVCFSVNRPPDKSVYLPVATPHKQFTCTHPGGCRLVSFILPLHSFNGEQFGAQRWTRDRLMLACPNGTYGNDSPPEGSGPAVRSRRTAVCGVPS
eukprot:TRINITY_DN19422_c0_g1_i1.p1 TRINITY_DN19422_c0_g1~~TRINITY_DN19422_c0_g1_i1.p1  ORF type:complete len:133 (+),score=4.63 TRINITY_DN19422_c0_g1_i1:1-399(+)